VGCPGTKHPISGGCAAAAGATVTASRPAGPPPDGDPVTGQVAWNCKFSAASSSHAAYALCCDTI
jgi:hypothetical protein